MASKVWFITGTSKGFGRIWAEAALARGDQVAATARDIKALAPLVERYGDRVTAIALDVTHKAAVGAAIKQAHARFGRLDVVINNAGYGLFGTIEEVNEAEARAQIETNLFGALWVTQAALPTRPAIRRRPVRQYSKWSTPKIRPCAFSLAAAGYR
jgi:NAD(P)-dependent dehydrogenase (short-subunit alcohol dehydrogenase family)